MSDFAQSVGEQGGHGEENCKLGSFNSHSVAGCLLHLAGGGQVQQGDELPFPRGGVGQAGPHMHQQLTAIGHQCQAIHLSAALAAQITEFVTPPFEFHDQHRLEGPAPQVGGDLSRQHLGRGPTHHHIRGSPAPHRDTGRAAGDAGRTRFPAVHRAIRGRCRSGAHRHSLWRTAASVLVLQLGPAGCQDPIQRNGQAGRRSVWLKSSPLKSRGSSRHLARA